MGNLIKAFFIYVWQHRGNYFRNIKARGLSDFFSEEKVLALLEDFLTEEHDIAFIDADQLAANGLTGDDKLAYMEQVLYRANKFPCNGCNENGECKFCHCPLPDKFFSKEGYCDGKSGDYLVWGEILSAEEWNKKKQLINIKINITED